MPLPQNSPMNITGTIKDKVIYNKVLQIIRSSTIGIYAGATLSAMGEGNVEIYRIADMLGSTNYTQSNKEDTPDKFNVNEIYLEKNNTRKVTYEVEDFDRSNIGSEFAAIEDVIASAIGLGISAEMDCEFMKAAYNAAVATTNFTVNAKYSTATTQAEMDTMFFQTADTASTLRGTIDKTIIGTDKSETVTFLNLSAKARFIKNGMGGNTNYEAYQNGKIEMINGVPIAESVFIGKNLAADATFSKDRAYDLSKLENLTLHTQAVALSFQMVKVTTNEDPNSGNPKTITKFKFGIAILRPKLIYMITNATPTPLTYANTKGDFAPRYQEGYDPKILKSFENKQFKNQMAAIQGVSLEPKARLRTVEKPKPAPVEKPTPAAVLSRNT